MTENNSEFSPDRGGGKGKNQPLTRRQFVSRAGALGIAGFIGGAIYGIGTYLENKARKKDEISGPPSATPEPTASPTASPTARPTETPASTETPIAKEASPKELLLQLGHHYSFSHPAFSFEVELTTQKNFNEKKYCRQRRYRVASFQGYDGLVAGNKGLETVINVHADIWDEEKLPGSLLIDNFKEGKIKTGDEVLVSDKETGESITLIFLGASEPVAAKLFQPGTWYQKAMEAIAAGEESPAYQAKQEEKNIAAILTCNPPINILTNDYESKRVFAFTPKE